MVGFFSFRKGSAKPVDATTHEDITPGFSIVQSLISSHSQQPAMTKIMLPVSTTTTYKSALGKRKRDVGLYNYTIKLVCNTKEEFDIHDGLLASYSAVYEKLSTAEINGDSKPDRFTMLYDCATVHSMKEFMYRGKLSVLGIDLSHDTIDAHPSTQRPHLGKQDCITNLTNELNNDHAQPPPPLSVNEDIRITSSVGARNEARIYPSPYFCSSKKTSLTGYTQTLIADHDDSIPNSILSQTTESEDGSDHKADEMPQSGLSRGEKPESRVRQANTFDHSPSIEDDEFRADTEVAVADICLELTKLMTLAEEYEIDKLLAMASAYLVQYLGRLMDVPRSCLEFAYSTPQSRRVRRILAEFTAYFTMISSKDLSGMDVELLEDLVMIQQAARGDPGDLEDWQMRAEFSI